jgi:hypothetical protein
MLLCRRFDIQLAEILPDLGILKSAAVEIKSSTRLRDVLAVSLIARTSLIGRLY